MACDSDAYALLYRLRGDSVVSVFTVRQQVPVRDLCLFRGKGPWQGSASPLNLPYGKAFGYCELIDEHHILLDAWTDQNGRWNIVCNHYCEACGSYVVDAVRRFAGDFEKPAAEAARSPLREDATSRCRFAYAQTRSWSRRRPEVALRTACLERLRLLRANKRCQARFPPSFRGAVAWPELVSSWPGRVTIFLWATLVTPIHIGFAAATPNPGDDAPHAAPNRSFSRSQATSNRERSAHSVGLPPLRHRRFDECLPQNPRRPLVVNRSLAAFVPFASASTRKLGRQVKPRRFSRGR
jgi:hypothetical protein